MTRYIHIHDLAQEELNDAARWYEEKSSYLRKDFLCEIEQASKNMLAFPVMFPEIADGIRRCTLKQFPYCLLYEVTQSRITIVAIMHQHRQPEYWQDRLDKT